MSVAPFTKEKTQRIFSSFQIWPAIRSKGDAVDSKRRRAVVVAVVVVVNKGWQGLRAIDAGVDKHTAAAGAIDVAVRAHQNRAATGGKVNSSAIDKWAVRRG